MSVRRKAYLLLTKAMQALDEVEDGHADTIRDAMDKLWQGMSSADRVLVSGSDYDPCGIKCAPCSIKCDETVCGRELGHDGLHSDGLRWW